MFLAFLQGRCWFCWFDFQRQHLVETSYIFVPSLLETFSSYIIVYVVLRGFCPKPVTHQKSPSNMFPIPVRTKHMTDWFEGFHGLIGAENRKWHVQIHRSQTRCQSNEAFRGVASQQQERSLTFKCSVLWNWIVNREMQVVHTNLHLWRNCFNRSWWLMPIMVLGPSFLLPTLRFCESRPRVYSHQSTLSRHATIRTQW